MFKRLILGMVLCAIMATPALAEKRPVVKFETNVGDIFIELYPEKAPISVQNFLEYVEDGFYNNVIFHRVIDGFMIQGGGFEPGMNLKNTRKPIINEATNGLQNTRGTISMARAPGVHSATSQFFINVKDNNFLDHRNRTAQGFGYAVFGKVIDGMDIVDKIKEVKTGRVGVFSDVPLVDVTIKRAVSMRRTEAEPKQVPN